MPTIADVMKSQGYATGQFGRNHLGDQDKRTPPTNHGVRRVLRQPLSPERRKRSRKGYFYPKDPEFKKKYRPRGVIHSLARRQDSRTPARSTPSLRAYGGRRVPDRRRRTSSISHTQGEQAVLRLVQQHLDAHLHAPEEGVTRQDGRAGIHADGMAGAMTAWSANWLKTTGRLGHRGQHDCALHHRQRQKPPCGRTVR